MMLQTTILILVIAFVLLQRPECDDAGPLLLEVALMLLPTLLLLDLLEFFDNLERLAHLHEGLLVFWLCLFALFPQLPESVIELSLIHI